MACSIGQTWVCYAYVQLSRNTRKWAAVVSSTAPVEDERRNLREKVVDSLRGQGFQLNSDRICVPDQSDKDSLRGVHWLAVQHRRQQGSSLKTKEPLLIQNIASGAEVNPKRISPRLVEVLPDSWEELLFRYAALHWSIPISAGYGRRIRFLVVDDHNDKLIGIIGLGDPVFSLRARDEWVGWASTQRKSRLRHVVDAYVLGAVPPYSYLLCGKLVAMLATSTEVRTAFENKYSSSTSLIAATTGASAVALVTTTSALGRSAVYNRIRFHEREIYSAVGYTSGSGEFHFSNGLYEEIRRFAESHCTPTAKHTQWGSGFRSKREVVRKVLSELGLPMAYHYHGVQRQVFVAPLGSNTQSFLQGDTNELDYYEQDATALSDHFAERWLIPRSERLDSYKGFNPTSYLLWHDSQMNRIKQDEHDYK